MSREIDLIWYEDTKVHMRIFNYEEFTKGDIKFLEDLTNWLEGKEIEKEANQA